MTITDLLAMDGIDFGAIDGSENRVIRRAFSLRLMLARRAWLDRLDGIVRRLSPTDRRSMEIKLDAFEARRKSASYARQMGEEMAHAGSVNPFIKTDTDDLQIQKREPGWYVCMRASRVGSISIPRTCLRPCHGERESARSAVDEISNRLSKVDESISNSSFEVLFLSPDGVEAYENTSSESTANIPEAVGQ